jgi:hypothetical protein
MATPGREILFQDSDIEEILPDFVMPPKDESVATDVGAFGGEAEGEVETESSGEFVKAEDQVDLFGSRFRSQIQKCCLDNSCKLDRFELESMHKHLISVNVETLFDYFHENESEIMIESVPNSSKWKEFLEDFWDYQEEVHFKTGRWTSHVTTYEQGRGKISAIWQVLKRYRGRYGLSSVTRNIVDVKLAIPDFNVLLDYHFTYAYFPKKLSDSIETLVRDQVNAAVVKLYKVYFTNDKKNKLKRRSWLCPFVEGSCRHTADESVPQAVIECLPQAFYDDRYPDPTGRVSDYFKLFSVLSQFENFRFLKCYYIFGVRNLGVSLSILNFCFYAIEQ